MLNAVEKGGSVWVYPFPYGAHELHIYGQAGRDTIIGGDGRDVICGGDGSDSLYGGSGDDILDGWTGCDVLNGGPGADRSCGYSGADWIVETNPTGIAYGESGNYDCLDVYSTVTTADCGSGYDGVEVYTSSNHTNCEYQAYCPWDWPSNAQAVCSDI